METCAVAIYEQINPFDAFGKTMLRNLSARNLELKSYTVYLTLESQQQRLIDNGFTQVTTKLLIYISFFLSFFFNVKIVCNNKI